MKIIKAKRLDQQYDIMVDDGDYDLLSRHRWYLLKSNERLYAYASFYVGNNKDKQIQMTHMIMGNHFRIDHIDNNSLNNQKYNLRPATHGQNEWNKGKQKTSNGKPCTSKYKGVHYDKQCGKYRATIKRNGIFYMLGNFINEEDAALAYNAKVIELSGEFAWVNTITPISKDDKA